MIDTKLVESLTEATIAHFRENELSRQKALAVAARRMTALGYTDDAATWRADVAS